MKCQTRKYFIQELKYFFSIGVSHTVALLGLLLLKFEKRFRKSCYNKKTVAHFVLMFPLGFMFFVLLEQVLQGIEQIMKPVRKLI